MKLNIMMKQNWIPLWKLAFIERKETPSFREGYFKSGRGAGCKTPSRHSITPAFMLGFILIFMLIESVSFAGKRGHQLPSLDTEERKLAFLLEVKRQIPALFSDAAKYDIDLFTLLENENELVKRLLSHREYTDLFSQKPYYVLTIDPPTEGIPVGSVEIQPEAIQAWKNSLKNTIEILKQKITEPGHLPSKAHDFIQALSVVPSPDPKKMIGTIGDIPEIKGRGQYQDELAVLANCRGGKKSLLEKYECIKKEYDKLEGLPKFPKREVLDNIIKAIQLRNTEEGNLNSIASVLAVMHRNPSATPPKTWNDLEDEVQRLTGEDLMASS